MSYFIVGFVCLVVGAASGMVITSLMASASMDDRCRNCLDIDDLK